MAILEHSIRPLGWALALLASCAPIQFSAEEIALRHDAESDTLDVLILYEEIQAARGEDGIGVAVRFASRAAIGRREFLIKDWPFIFDLDDIVKSFTTVDSDAKDPWLAWKREGAEHLEGIRVAAAGLYAGAEGRPSLYQHFRIEHASRLVEWLDRSLRIWIGEAEAKGTLEKDLALLDAETRTKWVNLAKTKVRWLTLADGGIQVQLPMGSKDAARLLARTIEEGARIPSAVDDFKSFAEGLDEIEIASGHLRVVWKSKDGVLRFRFSGTEEYDEQLAEQMRSWKDFPPKLPSRADVIRLFRGS